MSNIEPMPTDSLYVLILNYQSYQDTINYVEILQKQQNIRLNILIVDNCSPNDAYTILKNTFVNAKNVEVIKSERNGGYAYGNNYGLRYIEDKSIDYILISNNDIVINDDLLLYKLIQNYKQLENPAFASPVTYVNGKASKYSAWKMTTLRDDLIGSLRLFEIVVAGRRTYSITTKNENMKVDCLPGSFFIGEKEIFFDIGLMDENTFLYMEEDILAHKIKKLSLNNYLITSLRYEHMTAQTTSSELGLFNMRYYLIKSRVYFHEQYLHTSKVGIFLLKVLFKIWKIETYLYIKISGLFGKKFNYLYSK